MICFLVFIIDLFALITIFSTFRKTANESDWRYTNRFGAGFISSLSCFHSKINFFKSEKREASIERTNQFGASIERRGRLTFKGLYQSFITIDYMVRDTVIYPFIYTTVLCVFV